MTPEHLLFTDKTADTLIDALKQAAMVNISCGGEQSDEQAARSHIGPLIRKR
jgi:hypothetical protein